MAAKYPQFLLPWFSTVAVHFFFDAKGGKNIAFGDKYYQDY
jgi:hypothetical protein